MCSAREVVRRGVHVLVNYGSKKAANPTFENLRLLAAVLGTTVPDLMWDVFGGRDTELDPGPLG